MERGNYARKILYEMLANITGKNIRAVRMWFFRNKRNVLDHKDFFEYAETNRQKGGNI